MNWFELILTWGWIIPIIIMLTVVVFVYVKSNAIFKDSTKKHNQLMNECKYYFKHGALPLDSKYYSNKKN